MHGTELMQYAYIHTGPLLLHNIMTHQWYTWVSPMCHYFHDFGDFHEIMIFTFFTFFMILIILIRFTSVFTESSTFRPVGGFCQTPYKPNSCHFHQFLIFGDRPITKMMILIILVMSWSLKVMTRWHFFRVFWSLFAHFCVMHWFMHTCVALRCIH